MKNQVWMMLVCCLFPMLLIFILPALGFNNVNPLFVLIPIMLLMFFMMRGKGGCCGGHQHKKVEAKKK